MEKPCLQIKSITVSFNEDQMVLKILIFNPANRTIYAYAVPRRILYNSNLKELTICLHDKHIEDNSLIGAKLKEPKILELEADANTTMTLKINKVLKRLKSHTETSGNAEIEILNIYQAMTINIEIAHQDTPFYYNPKIGNAKQLKEWGKPISFFTQKIKDENNTKNH